MQNIHVTKAFVLHHASLEGGKQEFARGHHSVSEEIADHWFVKGHCDGGPTGVENDGKDARIAELEVENDGKDARIAELEVENADLKAALALYAEADAAKAGTKGKK